MSRFNELMDRFFELEPRQRLLGSIAAVLVVFGAYWWLVYSGRSAEKADLQSKIANLNEQKARKESLIANLAATREQVRELSAKVREAEVRLPDQKEIPDLLSNVSSAGRESGLEVMLFRQKAERYQDFYAEVPVEVLVRGNYHQVASFFDKVSRLDRIVNVSDISMKGPPTESPDMIVDTSLSAVTFRFLDEEERERIAKENAEKEKKNKKKGK